MEDLDKSSTEGNNVESGNVEAGKIAESNQVDVVAEAGKVNVNPIKKAVMIKKDIQLHGVGRRKRAIARVWVTKGSGGIRVNGKNLDRYFVTDNLRNDVVKALKITGYEKDFDVKVNVFGGGEVGQSQAARLGIARALLSFDESLRKPLRENSLLTVDSRIKERKKYGQRGARRKFQFVKR